MTQHDLTPAPLPLPAPTNHRIEAETAARAGQYDIARFHAEMFTAEQLLTQNRIEFLKADVPLVPTTVPRTSLTLAARQEVLKHLHLGPEETA